MFKPFVATFSAAALRLSWVAAPVFWRRLLTLRLFALCLLAFGLSATAQGRQPQPQSPQLDLPRLQLQAGLHLITVQVASTAAQRSTGLMWRRSMPPNEGMLFVFEAPAIQCFWMKNTFLPLTAAFVADDGRIVNLVDMQPLSERSHCSAEPVRFVLEMHQGWFAQRGIESGQRLRGAPFARTPQAGSAARRRHGCYPLSAWVIARPMSAVPARPPMSGVRGPPLPAASTLSMACSSASCAAR